MEIKEASGEVAKARSKEGRPSSVRWGHSSVAGFSSRCVLSAQSLAGGQHNSFVREAQRAWYGQASCLSLRALASSREIHQQQKMRC